MPSIRLGEGGAHLVPVPQNDLDDGGTPPDDPPAFVPLLAEHIRAFGDAPVDDVKGCSLFVGASSSPQHLQRAEWRYGPETIFLSSLAAQRAMESAFGRGRSVRVFHLPTIMLTAEEHALVGAELNTPEPFRDAHTRFSLAVRDDFEAVHVVKERRFWPESIRHAFEFLLGAKARLPSARWLVGLFVSADLPRDGVPTLAPVYTVARRSYSKRLVGGVEREGALLPGWRREVLQVTDRYLRELL